MRTSSSGRISLAKYLLGGTRSAVLAALLLHPEASLHVRELARATGASPGSLHRELRALTQLGVLTREEAGRQVYYRANVESPVFEDLAGLMRKTVGVVDVLHAALLLLTSDIAAAFVYGSVAAGREGPLSDIDVMVLGRASFAAVVRALAPIQVILRREINATVMKPGEFARKADDGFVVSVLRGPKLWLFGNQHDVAELSENRAA